MFCPTCGTKIPDDSKFCINCGNLLDESNKSKINNTSNLFGDFILTITTNPLSACKDFINKLSSSFVATYFIIVAILFSITNVVALKSNFSQYFIKIINISDKLKGNVLDTSDLYEITAFITPLKDTLFPFNKTFSWFLTFILVFYLVIILLSYFYHNIILKTQVNWKNYFIVSSVALTIQFEISLLYLITSFISLYLSIAIITLSTPLIIIVLYKGFSNFIETKPTTPYCFACIYAIANILSTYIYIGLASAHFINLTLSGFSNMLNLF